MKKQILTLIKTRRNESGHAYNVYFDVLRDARKRAPGLFIENLNDFISEHFLHQENEGMLLKINIEMIKPKFDREDINGQRIYLNDKVKFRMESSPTDPFGYDDSGYMKFRNNQWVIVDGDSEWSPYCKKLEIVKE